jgi:CheY-like chemotaxis protein
VSEASAKERTSPFDELIEPTDFRFELPDSSEGVVFVVDNDRTSGTLNAGILKGVGYNVRQFATPQEALAELEKAAPTILVTDFAMGGMSGLDLAQAAQEHDPDIAVILLTGSGDEATASPSHEEIREGVALLAEVCRREFGVPARIANVQRANSE